MNAEQEYSVRFRKGMCGIFGCVLKEGNAAPLIHSSLKHLEYRGYDSVGIATLSEGKVFIKKDQGKIDEVHKIVDLDNMPGSIGIGHTRWATHGAPLKVNSHPHTDCTGEIVVVHNGIIENFLELKAELQNLGHTFASKTDTEVMPHLIEETLKHNPKLTLQQAVLESLKRVEGSYAFAIISTREPDKIICARNESPLVLGLNHTGVFCASDIPAFLDVTNKAVMINNGELVILTVNGYEIKKICDGSTITREPITIEWTAEMAVKQGYPHFMIKEINEQPQTLRNTLRIQDHYLDLLATFLDRANEVFLVACGTSYHACLAASYMFSKLAFLPTFPSLRVRVSGAMRQISKHRQHNPCRKPIRRNSGYNCSSYLCPATRRNRFELNKRHWLHPNTGQSSLHRHPSRTRNRRRCNQNLHFPTLSPSTVSPKTLQETGKNLPRRNGPLRRETPRATPIC